MALPSDFGDFFLLSREELMVQRKTPNKECTTVDNELNIKNRSGRINFEKQTQPSSMNVSRVSSQNFRGGLRSTNFT